jgi:hypothetical protein
MFDWIEASWKDIKGNVKWDLIKYVFGGGVIATGYVLFRATTWQWRTQILLFVVSALGFTAISLYQRGNRVRLRKADSQKLTAKDQAEIASFRTEREQLKERFDLAIKTSDSAQQENRRLRDQLGQTEEKVEQILSVLKQSKLECDEIYADVSFGWLRDHIHSTGQFSVPLLAQSLELPEDAIRRGLGLLKSKYQLVSQRLPDVDMWTFIAGLNPFIPKYKIVPFAHNPSHKNLAERSMNLRGEIQDFSAEIGPKPEIEMRPGMTTKDFLRESHEKIEPWYDKLKFGYEQSFADRVNKLYLEFGERSMLPLAYQSQLSESLSIEDAIQQVVERLGKLADTARTTRPLS